MPIVIPDNLPYTAPGIECLRFGARRGGSGIGCCAVDVFQGFSNSPSAHCPPIPFFNGDSWCPEMHYNEKGELSQLYLTGTNEEVFLSYLTHGSFTKHSVDDHAFIAILTEEQCAEKEGRAWLRILKREGFKYVDTVNNGVYSEFHPNHIFMLVRNTHENLSETELETLGPPEYWLSLEEAKETPEERYRILSTEKYGKCFTTIAES